MVFLLKNVSFKPSLWNFWIYTEDFIAVVSNCGRSMTIVVNFMHFSQVDVASGPFKLRSKLTELWYFCLKKSFLSQHFGFSGYAQRILLSLPQIMFGL